MKDKTRLEYLDAAKGLGILLRAFQVLCKQKKLI